MPANQTGTLEGDRGLNPYPHSFVPEGDLNDPLKITNEWSSSSSNIVAPNSPLPPSPGDRVPRLSFSLDRGDYARGDILILDGWVEDTDGFNDIKRVDFSLSLQNRNNILDLADVTSFSIDPHNPNRGQFTYSLDLKDIHLSEGIHQLTLEGIVRDRSGHGYLYSQDFSLSNHTPSLSFNYTHSEYTPQDIFTLNSARAEDLDGLDNLDRIDFRMHVLDSTSSESYRVIDIADVTEFIPDLGSSTSGTFDYALDLKTLDLPLGNHRLALEGIISDRAGNLSSYNLASFNHNFNFINHNLSLSFEIDNSDIQGFHFGTYAKYDTLTLSNTKIEGFNDINDLGWIDFRVLGFFQETGETILFDIADVTEFEIDPNNSSHATFDYSLDLTALFPTADDLSIPEFILEGILYNKNGEALIAEDSVYFYPNHPKPIDSEEFTSKNTKFFALDLEFDDREYNSTEILEVTGTFAEPMGLPTTSQFVDRIDFRVRVHSENGQYEKIIDVADVTEFDYSENSQGIFNYSLDLKTLPLDIGSHTLSLEGTIYDGFGKYWYHYPLYNQGWDDNNLFTVNNFLDSSFLYFDFGIERYNYGANDILNLWGRATNPNGIANPDRIDLKIIVDSNQFIIDIFDITNFTPDLNNPNSAIFNTSIDLSTLPLPANDYSLQIVGTIYDKAGYGGYSFGQGFQLNYNVSQWSGHVPSLSFQLDRTEYSHRETLTLTDAWVEDNDGIADIDRIDFFIQTEDRVIIDVADVTQFNPDPANPNRATFDYNLDSTVLKLFPDEDLNLIGIVYDRSGSGSQWYHHPAFRLVDRPSNIDFQFDRPEYRVDDTLTLINGWVEDEDGLLDIERIDIRAIIHDSTLGSTIMFDLPDIAEFIPDPTNHNRGTFNYSFDLSSLASSLKFDEKTHTIELEAIIYESSGRGISHRSNRVLLKPISFGPTFDFKIDKNQYRTNETVTAIDAWVEDKNGWQDIERIDMKAIIYPNGQLGERIIDLPDITEFIPNPLDNNRGTFRYNLDLSTLNFNDFAGTTYSNARIGLTAVIYDKAGNNNFSTYSSSYSPLFSDEVAAFSIIPNTPTFNFEIEDRTYSLGETITVMNGWVEDYDGMENIDRIDFWAASMSGYGHGIDLPDVVQITPDPVTPHRGTFTYNLVLSPSTLKLNLDEIDYDPYFSWNLGATIYDKNGYFQSSSLYNGQNSFSLFNLPPSLNVELDNTQYSLNDELILTDSWVADSSLTDIDRLEFRLRTSDNRIIDLPGINNFTSDPDNAQRGLFNYSINFSNLGLDRGNYDLFLEGIVYDKSGNIVRGEEKGFHLIVDPPQNPPQDLRFSLDRNTYTPNATILLNNGWVSDEDGGDDIARIDLHLLDANNNMIADLDDITNLAIAAWSQNWASFNTQINLNGLNLIEGTYTISGIAYDLNNNVSNTFDRDFYLDVPQNQFSPSNLQFSLDRNTYKTTDTLQIRNGWVSDGDGADDLNRVEFKLVANNGTEVFLDAIDNLTRASWSPEWASFDRSFDLSQFSLTEGEYTLVGIAYDNAGQQSDRMERHFSLEVPQGNSQAPTGLQFRLDRNSFSSDNTIEITHGWVSDPDGNQDIDGITFEIVTENGAIIDISHSFNLTAATWDITRQWSSFYHHINLSSLGLSGGRYTLRGRAYDRVGNYSDAFSRMFAIA